MPEVIITALLPIITTLMLGFFAGWRQDFNAKQAAIFNKMVLRYALPMTLFAGILSMPKTQIFSSGPVVILLLLGMGGGYGITFLIARYLGRCPVNESALCALSVGAPAVPFVGISVLGHLFGSSSILLISICSLMMNIVQVPITVMLLSSTATADTENTSPHPSSFFQHIIHAFTEPIVIAPIAAILFVFCSIPLPEALKSSLMLLGKASGGVALFSSGIILFSHKVTLNFKVITLVVSKNIVMPLAIWSIAFLSKIPHANIAQTTITMAIPSAAITTMLAIRYGSSERDMASTLFFSTIFSIITMGGFILLITL